MSQIDVNWLKSETGARILQSILHDGRLKNFGLLEKPALASPYSQYQEACYKVVLIGSSSCGKTAFLGSLTCPKAADTSSLLSQESHGTRKYSETPGISLSHLYWPVKLYDSDKFLMANLAVWDVGKLCSTKYEYILPSCTNNLDCFIFVFSWTDAQSFLEVFNDVKKIYQDGKSLPKLVIGTKFDQIVHSEIDQEMVEELERLAQTRVIRFSSHDCGQEQIQFILNSLCESLIGI